MCTGLTVWNAVNVFVDVVSPGTLFEKPEWERDEESVGEGMESGVGVGSMFEAPLDAF